MWAATLEGSGGEISGGLQSDLKQAHYVFLSAEKGARDGLLLRPGQVWNPGSPGVTGAHPAGQGFELQSQCCSPRPDTGLAHPCVALGCVLWAWDSF